MSQASTPQEVPAASAGGDLDLFPLVVGSDYRVSRFIELLRDAGHAVKDALSWMEGVACGHPHLYYVFKHGLLVERLRELGDSAPDSMSKEVRELEESLTRDGVEFAA